MKIENVAVAAIAVLLIGCSKSEAQPAAAPAPAAATTTTATPEGKVRYDAASSGSKCTIAGTSTVHDWTMDSAIITGSIIADPGFPESALTDAAAAKPDVKVSIPVKSFKSGKQAMDKRMQDDLSATNYTKFEYRVIELKPKSKPGEAGPLKFDAVGVLTVVGNSVTNTMPVTIAKKDNKMTITGSLPIKFTDYKLKPTKVNLIGLVPMSVGDDLKITFEWAVAAKAPPKP